MNPVRPAVLKKAAKVACLGIQVAVGIATMWFWLYRIPIIEFYLIGCVLTVMSLLLMLYELTP